MAGRPRPRYVGYTAWRLVTPPVPVTETSESWGRGERFGYAPLPDGRVYCYATANAPEGTSDGGLAWLRRRFGGWHHPIPALLDAADPDAVLRHDLYELPPLKTYACGVVVLAGDAAHAMTPNLGQGACQALEDAVVLGSVMASGAGLSAYDRQRRSRTQMITRRSRRVGAAAQWASPGPYTCATLRCGCCPLVPGPLPRPGPGLGRVNGAEQLGHPRRGKAQGELSYEGLANGRPNRQDS